MNKFYASFAKRVNDLTADASQLTFYAEAARELIAKRVDDMKKDGKLPNSASLDFTIATTQEEFNKLTFKHIVETFAANKLEDITAEGFKELFLGLNTVFKELGERHIQMSLRNAILKKHGETAFIDIIASLQGQGGVDSMYHAIRAQVANPRVEALKSISDKKATLDKEIADLQDQAQKAHAAMIIADEALKGPAARLKTAIKGAASPADRLKVAQDFLSKPTAENANSNVNVAMIEGFSNTLKQAIETFDGLYASLTSKIKELQDLQPSLEKAEADADETTIGHDTAKKAGQLKKFYEELSVPFNEKNARRRLTQMHGILNA